MQHTTRFLTTAALVLITGSALAVQPQTEDAPLRGPQVRDAGKPDQTAQPADEMAAQKKIELPFMAYAAALRSLQRGEDESLRLTAEQTEQVRTISQEHREAMRAYMEEHQEEIAQLRVISGEPGPGMDREARPGQRPQGEEGDNPERPRREQVRERVQERRDQNRDGMQPEEGDRPRHSPEERAKAAERLRELMTAAPADAESKKKLMGVLTKEQQERVEAAVEAQRQRIREGRPAGPEGRRPGNPDAARPASAGEGERPVRRPARGDE
jgi:hypothetical protein